MNNKIIDLLIKEVLLASSANEVPVAAIIIKDNQIISYAHNLCEQSSSCLAHAEILAITEAQKKLKCSSLEGTEIHISLEPCLMCAGAISLAHISKVYFYAREDKMGALGSSIDIFNGLKNYYKPEIHYLPHEEFIVILKDFFKNIR